MWGINTRPTVANRISHRIGKMVEGDIPESKDGRSWSSTPIPTSVAAGRGTVTWRVVGETCGFQGEPWRGGAPPPPHSFWPLLLVDRLVSCGITLLQGGPVSPRPMRAAPGARSPAPWVEAGMAEQWRERARPPQSPPKQHQQHGTAISAMDCPSLHCCMRGE
uniref:Uncharacterized protein n=1 Tax=Rousettus aegyptiacus TaxID=9407 RepID=A0A7J8C2M2_ROUAE|nr:hypothetical protein HJG63_009431 [Rousettus aegyptiacus]